MNSTVLVVFDREIPSEVPGERVFKVEDDFLVVPPEARPRTRRNEPNEFYGCREGDLNLLEVCMGWAIVEELDLEQVGILNAVSRTPTLWDPEAL